MRRLAIALSLLTLVAASEARAARPADGWGLGVLIGEPVALSAEYQMGRDRAIDMGLGYSWGHSFHVFGDYLFQFLGAWEGRGEFISALTPYVGIGAFFQSHSSGHPHIHDNRTFTTSLGARIPLGVDWFVPDSPVQIFVELVPAFKIVPGLDFDFFGGVGARYFF